VCVCVCVCACTRHDGRLNTGSIVSIFVMVVLQCVAGNMRGTGRYLPVYNKLAR